MASVEMVSVHGRNSAAALNRKQQGADGGGNGTAAVPITSAPTATPAAPTQSGTTTVSIMEYNPTLGPDCLGNLKIRKPPFGLPTLLMSPDWTSWFGPTAVSLILAICGYALAHETIDYIELVGFLCDVAAAFTFSFLCASTDPGIWPRLAQGEPDPLEHESLPFCKQCNRKRPLRAAHCYTCGVCVLEHDHHCGVVGGCIGQRSLRFFVGYLVCISTSCLIMFWFVLRSLFKVSAAMTGPSVWKQKGLGDVVEHHNGKYRVSVGGRSVRTGAENSLPFAMHIVCLMAIGNVALIVGCMAVYYVGLLATDTTRREAQGKRVKPGERRSGWCGWVDNCKRKISPPESVVFGRNNNVPDDGHGIL